MFMEMISSLLVFLFIIIIKYNIAALSLFLIFQKKKNSVGISRWSDASFAPNGDPFDAKLNWRSFISNTSTELSRSTSFYYRE